MSDTFSFEQVCPTLCIGVEQVCPTLHIGVEQVRPTLDINVEKVRQTLCIGVKQLCQTLCIRVKQVCHTLCIGLNSCVMKQRIGGEQVRQTFCTGVEQVCQTSCIGVEQMCQTLCTGVGQVCQTLCIGAEQVCELALKQGFVREFDAGVKSPFAHKGRLWISYDDAVSLQYKVRAKQTAENNVTSCLVRTRLTTDVTWRLEFRQGRNQCHDDDPFLTRRLDRMAMNVTLPCGEFLPPISWLLGRFHSLNA